MNSDTQVARVLRDRDSLVRVKHGVNGNSRVYDGDEKRYFKQSFVEAVAYLTRIHSEGRNKYRHAHFCDPPKRPSIARGGSGAM